MEGTGPVEPDQPRSKGESQAASAPSNSELRLQLMEGRTLELLFALRDRDRRRSRTLVALLAFLLMLVFSSGILYLALSARSFELSPGFSDVRQLILALLAPITGILGAALGFYFGSASLQQQTLEDKVLEAASGRTTVSKFGKEHESSEL
jgi:hypothetical protein